MTAEPTQPAAAVPPEVRLNDDGTLDEVVGTGTFHLEQMDKDHWWMCFESGGRSVDVWLHARGKITATYEEFPVAARLHAREAAAAVQVPVAQLQRINETHTGMPLSACVAGADHGEELGLRHRHYKQSMQEECYICTLLQTINALRAASAPPPPEGAPVAQALREPDPVRKLLQLADKYAQRYRADPQPDANEADDWGRDALEMALRSALSHQPAGDAK